MIENASNTNTYKNHTYGEIVAVSNDGVDVITGDGILRLEVCQRDGSKPMPINQFCNGYPFKLGDTLGAELGTS